MKYTDVAIIGGGLAGLSAAYNLEGANFKVILLEADGRLGGRTHGERWEPAGRKIDLGGTWLLPGFAQSFQLLKELGVETVESPSSDLWLTHLSDGVQTRRFLDETQLRQLHETAARLESIAEEAGPYHLISGAEALARLQSSEQGLAPIIADWHSATQRYLSGSNMSEMSIDHLLLDLKDLADPEHYHTQIAGTTRALVEALTANISAEIKLKTPVTKIARAGEMFHIQTSTGETISATHVIVAAPLNTLSQITFDADLLGPAARDLIAKKHVGASRKDWFVLSGVPQHFRVFASTGPYGYFRSEVKLDADKMLCVGLTPSHEGDPTVAELEEAIRQYLPDAKVEAHTSFDWLAHEWARGTWFVPRPGQYQQLAEVSPAPGLFFVGGDFDTGFPGTIEGAIATGKNAALAIKNNPAVDNGH